MEEDDLLDDGLLPSDLFGDTDIFKLMNANEGDVDIDESALDDAEKEDGENKNPAEDEDSKASNDLADALGLSNFNLDSKDMEDIFNGMIDDEESKDGAESSVASEASSAQVDPSQQQQQQQQQPRQQQQ